MLKDLDESLFKFYFPSCWTHHDVRYIFKTKHNWNIDKCLFVASRFKIRHSIKQMRTKAHTETFLQLNGLNIIISRADLLIPYWPFIHSILAYNNNK